MGSRSRESKKGVGHMIARGGPPHPDKMGMGALVCVAEVGDCWRGKAMKGIQGEVREANFGIWDSQHGGPAREWLWDKVE